jgi:hypothetical protein
MWDNSDQNVPHGHDQPTPNSILQILTIFVDKLQSKPDNMILIIQKYFFKCKNIWEQNQMDSNSILCGLSRNLTQNKITIWQKWTDVELVNWLQVVVDAGPIDLQVHLIHGPSHRIHITLSQQNLYHTCELFAVTYFSVVKGDS